MCTGDSHPPADAGDLQHSEDADHARPEVYSGALRHSVNDADSVYSGDSRPSVICGAQRMLIALGPQFFLAPCGTQWVMLTRGTQAHCTLVT